MLVRTSNSQALQASKVIKPGHKGRILGRFIFIDDRTFSKIFKTASRQEDRQKEKLLALHESIRAPLLDELKRFGRVHWTTDIASVKDARYILDYVADSYSVGKDPNQQQFKLSTGALLVMKDALEDKEVLKSGSASIRPSMWTRNLFSMIFTKKQLALWRKKCRRCLIENARLRLSTKRD